MARTKDNLEHIRIFVDAYNVIGDDPVLHDLAALNMEQAREILRKECLRYAARYPGHIIYLVFDGDSAVSGIPGKSSGRILNEKRGIREVFSRTGQTADQWILYMVGEILPGHQSLIVTCDIELIQEGVMRGASSMTPAKFLVECRLEPKFRKRRKYRSGTKLDEPCGAVSGSAVSNDSEEKVSPGSKKSITGELMSAYSEVLDDPLDL